MKSSASVDEQLLEAVRALLPETRRNGLIVTRHALGVTLHFTDAQHRQHTIEARLSEAGGHYTYSYSLVDVSEDLGLILDAFQAVLKGTMERDGANGEPHEDLDLLAQPPAGETLTTRITSLLPEDWRHEVRVVRLPDGFAVGFQDATGGRHLLQARRLEASVPALVQGQRFGFSYPRRDDAIEDPAVVARYQEIFEALRGQEDDLFAEESGLPPEPAPRPEDPFARAAVPASTDADPGAATELPFDFLAQPSAGEALTAQVTSLLPEDWRHEVRAVRLSDGFAVGFQDASGGRHLLQARGLEAGVPALVQGQRFSFSYLRPEGAPEDPATIARYSEVLEAFGQQEELLAQGLLADAAPDAEKERAAEDAGFDFLAQPPAGEALTARVTSLLPEDWRHEVRVVRLSDGFAVGFQDATGGRHLFQARGLEAGVPARCVLGQHFSFSYLRPEDAPEDPATIARYREALEVLRWQEDLIAQDLAADTAAEKERTAEDAGFDFLAQPTAGAMLTARVTSLLPEDWRHEVRAVRLSDGFAVSFQDASGGRHLLQARGLEAGVPALVQGQRFGFSYLRPEGAPEDPATTARYGEVLEVLRWQEDLIAQDLAAQDLAAQAEAEKERAAEDAGFDFLAQPTAGETLTARVTSLLPEDWRHEVRAVRLSDGFAVGFQDASGGRHLLQARGLEAGVPALVQGQRFGFSYLRPEGAPEDPATTARYGEVLEVLRWQEDLIAQDLAATADTTEKVPAGSDVGFDFLAQPSAGEALAARVTSLLPEDWRHEVRAVRLSDGFAVSFQDASGGRHLLQARGLEAGVPALVQGQRFGFSYLRPEGTPEDPATTARYGEVLEVLRWQEDLIAQDLAATTDTTEKVPAGSDVGFDFLAQPTAGEALAARVTSLLPEDWRHEVRAVRLSDGFAVSFQDASGGRHLLQARGLETGVPALVQGQRFGFSYLRPEGAPEDPATTARYGEVLEVLRWQEDLIAQDLAAQDLAAQAEAEKERTAEGAGFDFLAQPPAGEALTARVTSLLPEDWRHEVRAVRLPDGFAVSFQDASGGRHLLQARGLEAGVPALVQGQRFGFSYLRPEDAPEDPASIARYREVLEVLRWQEDLIAQDLAATTDTTEKVPAGSDVGFDFLAQPPVGEALSAQVTSLLPEDWRHEVRVVRLPDGFAVGFRDAAGRQHGLQVCGPEAVFHPFVRGQRLGFSYLLLDDTPEDPATIARYKEVLEDFCGKEDLLVRDL